MAVQYWIDDFFVDPSRNQISQGENAQTIAPKALAVLTYLAENHGQVVSQEALLDKVWQDTAVTPNTLQRSIAQLRKALGDDAKNPHYIKTHAEQGYSLECDVRWHDQKEPKAVPIIQEATVQELVFPEVKTISEPERASKPKRLPHLFIIAAVFIGLCVIGYNSISWKQTTQPTFENLRSLTATDDKEFDATYTPDGQYIVFHRYLDKFCRNRLWAKRIGTQEEILLTAEWGNYGAHSFSKDGKRLIFLESDNCDRAFCFDLMEINFEQALISPQQPTLILQCRHSEIRKPTWLSNDHIAMMQRTSNRWKLIRYSPSSNQSSVIHDPENGDLIDFAYSMKDDLFAVVSVHEDDEHYLEMLKPDGRVVSSHKIQRPAEIPKYRPIFPNFDPRNDQLIFSTGRQLFNLSYEGEVSKISLPSANRMMQPVFHPNGKRMLMIKGPYDSDIVQLPLQQIAAPDAGLQAYASFERSNVGEDFAIFQPGGERIAFWSERSGEEQLWVSDGHNAQQLTQFTTDTYIRGIHWAQDGNSLLVNANNVLHQVWLDRTHKTFPLAYPVSQLFQWDSNNHRALLKVRIKGVMTLVDGDLQNLEVTKLTDAPVKWALRSDDGRLIYKDHSDQFWQPGAVEHERIAVLDGQGKRDRSFVMHGNVIYAVNEAHELWSYDLDSEAFEILGEVDSSVDYVTDVNETHLLMSIQVSAKKEVMELIARE